LSTGHARATGDAIVLGCSVYTTQFLSMRKSAQRYKLLNRTCSKQSRPTSRCISTNAEMRADGRVGNSHRFGYDVDRRVNCTSTN